ncbi:MAG: hypothetical protein FWD61_13705 [Phycisphaerales bacterium]|nr:hypothetical protein [Phycisphaerales bacterium]
MVMGFWEDLMPITVHWSVMLAITATTTTEKTITNIESTLRDLDFSAICNAIATSIPYLSV